MRAQPNPSLPSIRDLRDVLAREKKCLISNEARHVRIRLYEDRWAVDGGTSQFIAGEPLEVLVVHYTDIERATNSYFKAKLIHPELKEKLKNALEARAVGQAGARTGRSDCTKPNLANLPTGEL